MYDPVQASQMFYKDFDSVGNEWNIYEVDGAKTGVLVHDNMLCTCLTEPEADKVLYALVFCYEDAPEARYEDAPEARYEEVRS